ncbi:MAG: hypothetical protein CMJ31_13130 [Phycisphaerae bacterium]|nr:hypothetical protein [Phycisphaerae bacterium]
MHTHSIRPVCLALVALGAFVAGAVGQTMSRSPLSPPRNGVRVAENELVAFVNATIHPEPGVTLEDAMLVVFRGRVQAVSEQVEPPAGARVHDLGGRHVYPAFVDAWVETETPEVSAEAPGRHWNALVTPERSVLDGKGLSEKAAEGLRKNGFGAVAAVPEGGIFAGRAAVVSTAARPSDGSAFYEPLYRADVFNAADFMTVGWGGESYPTSHPGCVALMRQALLDADWQARRARQTRDAGQRAAPNALTALAATQIPIFFDCALPLEVFLAGDIAAEFRRSYVIVGSGEEYKWIDPVVELGVPIVTPLRFPAKPDVTSVGRAEAVEIEEMMSWEQAPAGPARLARNGVPIAITSSMLPEGRKFLTELRKAVSYGLSPEAALAALTTNPARMLGMESQLGKLDRNFRANFIVADGPIFDDDARVLDVWIDGVRHAIDTAGEKGLEGSWRFTVGDPDAPVFERVLKISEMEKGKAKIALDKNPALEDEDPDHVEKVREVSVDGRRVSFVVDDPQPEGEGGAASVVYILTGSMTDGDTIRGSAVAPDQSTFQWLATRNAPENREAASEESFKPFEGEWRLELAERFRLDLKIDKDGAATIGEDTDDGRVTTDDVDVAVEGDVIEIDFDHTPFGMEGRFTLRGTRAAGAVFGTGERSDGEGFTFVALRPENDPAPHPGYPFGPYAVAERPSDEPVLITNATVWTQGEAGVIENGYVLLEGGKVSRVGAMPEGQTGLPVNRRTRTIDADGMHVSPGLIDAHSHTSLFRLGVNEGGQAVTAEVRISDSIDPSAINWYRQLAHGVTTVLNLHGSANPIGGQSQTTKVRWGVSRPRDMYMEDAQPGIKFALGENVKRSNWGPANPTRYPATRMGVETLIRDRFTAAREYLEAKNAREGLDGLRAELRSANEAGNSEEASRLESRIVSLQLSSTEFRRDLELEALAQILTGERLIHCHSYRQDEILMLARIAEDFGFKIGTYTHGLEVYKVADAVKENAIGASLFSDWWAYKVEVQDAIPYAGPLQSRAGVLTSYNSDSDELARRMNLEAAKVLKYGGVDENGDPYFTAPDALAFVTRNPAIQLMVDDRIGSIEAGKDADVVIWDGSPLGSRSNVQRVFIDGAERWSVDSDAAHREWIRAERQRLTQKMLASKDASSGSDDKASGSGSKGSDDDEGAEEEDVDSDEPPYVRRRRLLAQSMGMTPEGLPTQPAEGDCGCLFHTYLISERDAQ